MILTKYVVRIVILIQNWPSCNRTIIKVGRYTSIIPTYLNNKRFKFDISGNGRVLRIMVTVSLVPSVLTKCFW